MNTVNSPAGSVLYWAVIDTAQLISKAEFINASLTADACAFDDFTAAAAHQIRRLPVFRCFFK